MLLFEFPNRYMAEQIIQGSWRWKNPNFNLEWWNPKLGSIPNSTIVNETWIRVIGIPLHLWSQKVFQQIRDFCGGRIETEEETELKNHMKWDRILVTIDGRCLILVTNDGRCLPRKVSISWNGVTYYVPIWAECKMRFEVMPENDNRVVGEEIRNNPGNRDTQRTIGENICQQVQKLLWLRDLKICQHMGEGSETSWKRKSFDSRDRHVRILNGTLELGLQQKPTPKEHSLVDSQRIPRYIINCNVNTRG